MTYYSMTNNHFLYSHRHFFKNTQYIFVDRGIMGHLLYYSTTIVVYYTTGCPKKVVIDRTLFLPNRTEPNYFFAEL